MLSCTTDLRILGIWKYEVEGDILYASFDSDGTTSTYESDGTPIFSFKYMYVGQGDNGILFLIAAGYDPGFLFVYWESDNRFGMGNGFTGSSYCRTTGIGEDCIE